MALSCVLNVQCTSITVGLTFLVRIYRGRMLFVFAVLVGCFVLFAFISLCSSHFARCFRFHLRVCMSCLSLIFFLYLSFSVSLPLGRGLIDSLIEWHSDRSDPKESWNAENDEMDEKLNCFISNSKIQNSIDFHMSIYAYCAYMAF